MGKWKLIIMILFILNDYLKPPKAQPNLSIRHSGPHNGTQRKRPSLKMVNRLGEKQRPGIERNFPEVPRWRQGKELKTWEIVVSSDQGIVAATPGSPNIFTWKKVNSSQCPGRCSDRAEAPNRAGGTALVLTRHTWNRDVVSNCWTQEVSNLVLISHLNGTLLV